MNLLTFLPRATDSFDLLRRRFGALLRLAWLPLITMLAAPVLQGQGGAAGQAAAVLLNALAFGVFGVGWMRLAAFGEEPGKPVHLRLGKRELLTAVVGKALEGFAYLPLIMMVLLVSQFDRLPVPAPLLAYVPFIVFMALAGMLYLILPDIALRDSGSQAARLFELVAAGGLPVGVGFVASGLPFIMVIGGLQWVLPAEPQGLGGALLAQAALFVPTCLLAAATGGFLALAWTDLVARVAERAKATA